MTAKQKLLKLAEENDIDLEISNVNLDNALSINAYSPQGKKFRTGTHCVVIANGENDETFKNTWKTALDALIDDLGDGFIDCDEGLTCEVCYPDSEDEEIN